MGRQLLHSRRVLLPNRPNRKSPRSPKPLQRQQRRRPRRKPHRTSTNARASAISIRPRTYAPAGSPATASTRAISCGADTLNPTNAETSVLNRAPEHRHLPQSRNSLEELPSRTIRPAVCGGRERWLSSYPGSFRRNNSLRRLFSPLRRFSSNPDCPVPPA